MHQIPFQTSRAPGHKEGRDVQHHYFIDSGQGFVCLNEGGGGGGHFYAEEVPRLSKDQQQTLTWKSKKDWPVFRNM